MDGVSCEIPTAKRTGLLNKKKLQNLCKKIAKEVVNDLQESAESSNLTIVVGGAVLH